MLLTRPPVVTVLWEKSVAGAVRPRGRQGSFGQLEPAEAGVSGAQNSLFSPQATQRGSLVVRLVPGIKIKRISFDVGEVQAPALRVRRESLCRCIPQDC